MPLKVEDIASIDTHRLSCRQEEIAPNDAAIEHAIEQIEAPKQAGESSKTYRRCQAAAQRVRETPSRGDAASEASESISHISSLYPPLQRILLLDKWKLSEAKGGQHAPRW
jgi:glutamyl-tRNA reductase